LLDDVSKAEEAKEATKPVEATRDSAPPPAPAPVVPVPAAETSSGSQKCNPNIRKFMIAVVTSPTHFLARQAIRITWAADAKSVGVPVKFFIGQVPEDKKDLEIKLRDEPDDVVRLNDFTEDYHNLTAKALDIFSYAFENCYTGVMKVDDDSYVRANHLLEFLATQSDWTNMYAGSMTRKAPVIKDPNGRWFAFDQYPHDTWPTYANGPGFFLGHRALQYLYENKATLNKIRIDDAAVGVWTEPLQLKIVDMPSSIYEYHPKKDGVFQNPVNAEEMIRLKNDETFVPFACQDDQAFACLCWGNPRFSGQEMGECWDRAGRVEYADKTLRA